ncbi:hypothetical protein VitviT2T_020271 [Vitis vinifera]|uniref:Terpene synthase N-terminal domain-containing protein n=1 Tax=Vitis vinifera TaxID=29760 RepID=A0ABY9D3G2_VITVI|nr:hypothetical protein VitviT2T_020271 [Vitis vinifera]
MSMESSTTQTIIYSSLLLSSPQWLFSRFLKPPVLRNAILPPRRDFWLRKSFSGKAAHPVQSIVVNRASYETAIGRTANYQAPIWDYDYVQSLRSDYRGKTCIGRFDTLTREVKMMLGKVEKPLDQLELIDLSQRLGISYQFEDEIKRLLNSIYCNYNMDDEWKKENLHATALEFRILRQHGYCIPQGVSVISSFLVQKDEVLQPKAF